jgi:hypothetical protein
LHSYLLAFLSFISVYRPSMPLEERQLLPVAIYEGVHHDRLTAFTFTGMCQIESGMKVRRWYPDVKPELDAAGTHNDLLCLELHREKLVTDSWRWRKSKQWPQWYKLFQQRPDVGTMIAARAFSRIVNECGLDNAVQIWKTGKVGTIRGLVYLMKVKQLRGEMTKMCQR